MKHIVLLFFVLLTSTNICLAAQVTPAKDETPLYKTYTYGLAEVKSGLSLPDKKMIAEISAMPRYGWDVAHFFGNISVNQMRSKAYVGPRADIDLIGFGLGAGLQTVGKPWLLGSHLILRYQDYNLWSVFEYGGNGSWYQFEALYNFEQLALSLQLEKDLGLGPKIRYSSKDQKMSVSFSPLYNFSSSSVRLMLTFSAGDRLF